ncbi:tRNA dihydrouridine synthase DusB [Prochlorococcus sp. MIT 1223]|uniref:tRNA dihydrouridine synthase DusB n=1 Tax=Prochlorococcus sp. MIT 1223 TaxID=3096217 RepID=UPI002A766990|nr:tRNA dihydrouridine synthase DusB [Prochlorococcus sp. MIT 1223]
MNRTLNEIHLPGRGTQRILKSIVLQSPLAGISDQIFRKLVRKWAPEALLFTEMVNANSLELGYGREKIKELSKEKGPVGVQLFDFRIKPMIEAAKRAEEAGAYLIDINMGCPVKKITKKGGGSGLLRDLDLAAEIISEISNAVKIPVTVKTRLGWCNKSYDPIGLALHLQDAGAQLLTFHGRTRQEGFSGKSNWVAIAEIKKRLSIPIIANGDISTLEDARKCLKITGADGVMIGRGSLGTPWFVGQIDSFLKSDKTFNEPTTKMRLEIALEHLESLLQSKGEHGLLIARKHLNWTCKDFEGSKEFRKDLLKANSSKKAISLIKEKIKTLD